MPYIQFKSVDDFIPEPRCSKFAVGYKREEERWGVREVRSEGPRAIGAPLRAKCSSVRLRFEPGGSTVVD